LPFGQADVTVETVENNLRFAGQYYDQETGLHYNYYRYYDPKLGRYLKPDPIGLEGGVNVYVYVKNNPIDLVDPQGLKSCKAGPCLKIFQYPFFRKTGEVEDGNFFSQRWTNKCIFIKMKRYQKKWYLKDVYVCREREERCGKCYLKRMYIKTEERDHPKGTFWSGWEKVGQFSVKAIHWNVNQTTCPMVPNYKGPINSLVP
jgi:RHS repeat-associated protein